MVLVGSTSSKAILSHETSGLDDHQLHLQLFPVQIRSFLIVSQHRWSSSFFLRYYLQIAPVHKFSLGLYPWRMDDFFGFNLNIQHDNAGMFWMKSGWNIFGFSLLFKMAMQVCFEWRMDEIALFHLLKYILDDYAILCEVRKKNGLNCCSLFSMPILAPFCN